MRQLLVILTTLLALNLNAQCEFTVSLDSTWQCNSLAVQTTNNTYIIEDTVGVTITVTNNDPIIFTTNACTQTSNFYIDYVEIDTVTVEGASLWWAWAVNCTALPVELVYFDSEVIADGNILYWRTAMEENVSHFDVEVSADGRFFYSIHKETAKNKPAQYTHLHENVIGTVYYRLKSVDLDGSEQYSSIITVESYEDKVVIQNPLPQGDTTHNSKFYIYDFMGRYLGMNVSNLPRGLYLFENPKPNYTFVVEIK